MKTEDKMNFFIDENELNKTIPEESVGANTQVVNHFRANN
jgi:hypothetical protein